MPTIQAAAFQYAIRSRSHWKATVRADGIAPRTAKAPTRPAYSQEIHVTGSDCSSRTICDTTIGTRAATNQSGAGIARRVIADVLHGSGGGTLCPTQLPTAFVAAPRAATQPPLRRQA